MKWSERKRKNKLEVVTHSKQKDISRGMIRTSNSALWNSERNKTFKKTINYESRNTRAKETKLGTNQNPSMISRALLSREGVPKKRNKNIVVFA